MKINLNLNGNDIELRLTAKYFGDDSTCDSALWIALNWLKSTILDAELRMFNQESRAEEVAKNYPDVDAESFRKQYSDKAIEYNKARIIIDEKAEKLWHKKTENW